MTDFCLVYKESRVIQSLQDRIDALKAENAELEKPRHERKYFLPEHELLLAKMVPPDDGTIPAADTDLGETLPTLADLTQSSAEVTGNIFAQMMLAGFINLYDNMDRLNKENQFPIPGNVATSR
jgi:hypothetical protein